MTVFRSCAGVMSQKFDDKVFPFRAAVPQPRQGRKIVAQGASPGGRSPHPAFGTPLPRGRERGRGRGRVRVPTADEAVGYILSPAERPDFFNELLTQDTSLALMPQRWELFRSHWTNQEPSSGHFVEQYQCTIDKSAYMSDKRGNVLARGLFNGWPQGGQNARSLSLSCLLHIGR